MFKESKFDVFGLQLVNTSENRGSMNAMGFRAEKDTVQWALVSGNRDQPVLLAHDRLRVPDGLSESNGLRWLRSELQFLLEQYRPDAIAIRLLECHLTTFPTPKGLSLIYKRARIEGILLEVCCPRQENASWRRTITRDDESKGGPRRNLFVDPDGRDVDWREISSKSRRQAIVIAATLLPAGAAQKTVTGTG